MRKFIIPDDVADPDLPTATGKPWSMSWQLFLREHLLSWKGWDESDDLAVVAVALMRKFEGKGAKSEIVLTEKEWEKGNKALDAAEIAPIFRAAVRPFRVAWKTAPEIDEKAAKALEGGGDRGDPTPTTTEN